MSSKEIRGDGETTWGRALFRASSVLVAGIIIEIIAVSTRLVEADVSYWFGMFVGILFCKIAGWMK